MTTCMILKNDDVVYVTNNLNEAVYAIEAMCIDACIKKRGFDYIEHVNANGGIFNEISLNNQPRGFYCIKQSHHHYQIVYKNKNGWMTYGSIVKGDTFKLYIGRRAREIKIEEQEEEDKNVMELKISINKCLKTYKED